MIRLGMNAKLYVNTGNYATPVWTEDPNVRDLTLSLQSDETDVTTRGNNGWKATTPTLSEATVDFEKVWDEDDALFTVIRTAFMSKTPLEVLVLSGPIGTSGSQGLRATVAVPKFDRNEPLREAITVKVQIKPTYSAHAPEWVVVGAGSNIFTFDVALVDGAGSINLTAIPYGAGTVDGTGKKVVAIQIANSGDNALTVSKAVSNGYDLFASNDPIVVPAGGTVKLTGTSGVNVDSTHKVLTLAGTGTQSSTWTITLA